MINVNSKIKDIDFNELKTGIYALLSAVSRDFGHSDKNNEYLTNRLLWFLTEKFNMIDFGDVKRTFEQISTGDIEIKNFTLPELCKALKKESKISIDKTFTKEECDKRLEKNYTEDEKNEIFIYHLNRKLNDFYNKGVEYHDINNNLHTILLKSGRIKGTEWEEFTDRAKANIANLNDKNNKFKAVIASNSVESEAKKLFIIYYLSTNKIALNA